MVGKWQAIVMYNPTLTGFHCGNGMFLDHNGANEKKL